MGDSVVLICVAIYMLSIMWCFSFAAVSLSTGELKPRSIFLDENAFSVKFSPSINRRLPKCNLSDCSSWDSLCTCTTLPTSYATCHLRRHNQQERIDSVSEVIEITIQPKSDIMTNEVNVFAFPVSSHKPELWLLEFVRMFCSAVHSSPWASRTVRVLLVPVIDTHAHINNAVDKWATHMFSPPLISIGNDNSLVRSAYVVQLGSGSSSAQLSKVKGWEGDIIVRAPGLNGQLPNMDMLANLRAITSRTVLFNDRSETATSLLKHCVSAPMCRRFTPYLERLIDLFFFSVSMLFDPSGFHHYLLSKNIDAVSVSFGNPIIEPMIPQKRLKAIFGVDELMELLLRILRTEHMLHGILCYCVRKNMNLCLPFISWQRNFITHSSFIYPWGRIISW